MIFPDIPRQTWHDEAACTSTDPDLFHPETVDAFSSYRSARRICNQCPVAAPCLEYALTARESTGMWGGLTPHERREILQGRAQIPSAALA